MSEITLDYPIDVDGKKVNRVTTRRLTALDLELAENGNNGNNVTKTIMLCSATAEMSPDDVRKLDAKDFGKLTDEVNAFLG
jgi:hypothetical protein